MEGIAGEAARVLIFAILSEALWETLKPVWRPEKRDAGWWGPLVVSVALAVLAGIDLFSAVGMPLLHPVAGMVLTGVLASRGSKVLHDLFDRIKGDDQ